MRRPERCHEALHPLQICFLCMPFPSCRTKQNSNILYVDLLVRGFFAAALLQTSAQAHGGALGVAVMLDSSEGSREAKGTTLQVTEFPFVFTRPTLDFWLGGQRFSKPGSSSAMQRLASCFLTLRSSLLAVLYKTSPSPVRGVDASTHAGWQAVGVPRSGPSFQSRY